MNDKELFARIKAFGMTNQMITEDIQRIGTLYSVNFGHVSASPDSAEAVYYPQFDTAVRAEAALMAKHYETFYSLEKSIRELVSETLEAAEKPNPWWDSKRVPTHIHAEVASRIQKEIDAGITRRSNDELDYTNFGELSVIIVSNWDIFGGLFTSRKAKKK